MAELSRVTFTWEDSEGKTTTRSYQGRTNDPTDVQVQALAADAQALSAWSLKKAVVTRVVDVTAQSSAAEAGSSVQRDASLVYNPTSLADASLGGSFTFPVPQFKAALLDANGRIDPTAAVFDSWTENFDDGSGVAAVDGDWYAGNQQQLVEEEDPDEGFQNKR